MVCCWLRDFFEEAGISCSLATFVCGGDHGSLFLYNSHWVRLVLSLFTMTVSPTMRSLGFTQRIALFFSWPRCHAP